MKSELRIMNGSEQQPPSEQIPPVETGTNFRVPVEVLIPEIKPIDSNYRFDTKSSRNAKAGGADVLLREMISYPRLAEFCKENLQGQVLVDLGAYTTDGYLVACACRARGYVAAEPFNFQTLEESFGNLREIELPVGSVSEWKNNKNIPYTLVNSDAVGFLRRLPPWSVSVMMTNIDSIVIPDSGYQEWLRGQIQRVLHKDGAFISYMTSPGFNLGPDFDERIPDGNPEALFIRKYTRRKY
jgi:hypothetical protein